MSLRRRLGLVAGATAAIAILTASIVCYLVVRGQLRGEVDNALNAQAESIEHGDFHALAQPLPGLPASAGGPAQYVQVVGGNGVSYLRRGDVTLPVDARALAVAGGNGSAYIRDVRVAGSHLRELVFPVSIAIAGQPESAAVQLARPLVGVDHVLRNLRLILALLCLGGIAAAAALGRLAARRVLAPLAEVAATAQHIGETEDLTSRIHVHADDEVGQLARRFNTMLERLQSSRAELDESVRAQRQLVADASHELRTPITSLRTNIEVLLASEHLDEEERRRLLGDVVEQSQDLTELIGDLIDLARGDLPVTTAEDVRLDRIVAESVARARRDAPTVSFETSLEPVTIAGIPDRLARAVNNLLDNAARHSPPRAVVEVAVDEDGVRVRDHGSGVDEADLPHVFDRFFRGANARDSQGSGLGLAIVRQVALQHGGSVSARNAPDGGAIFALHLPSTPAPGTDQPLPDGGVKPGVGEPGPVEAEPRAPV
jgi:two-component system sensor histidine kinase MprB